MTFLEVIKILKNRNQAFVNKKGVSDYSKKSDEIIKTCIKQYATNKSLENEIEEQQQVINSLHEIIDKYRLLFQIFGISSSEFESFHNDFLKIIIREDLNRKKYKEIGFYDYQFLRLDIWDIELTVKSELNIIKLYVETNPFFKEQLRQDNPDYIDYFNQIDTIEDAREYDTIIYNAYKDIVSRLTFVKNAGN